MFNTSCQTGKHPMKDDSQNHSRDRRVRNPRSDTQRKRNIDVQKWIFDILVADGTAKLSGGDHEFRQPTPRREQLLRSENVKGELQGEPEGFHQPTETKDDAEARNDFWSIQGHFIYCHHIKRQVQLCAEGRNIPYSTEHPLMLLGLLTQISTFTCRQDTQSQSTFV